MRCNTSSFFSAGNGSAFDMDASKNVVNNVTNFTYNLTDPLVDNSVSVQVGSLLLPLLMIGGVLLFVAIKSMCCNADSRCCTKSGERVADRDFLLNIQA